MNRKLFARILILLLLFVFLIFSCVCVFVGSYILYFVGDVVYARNSNLLIPAILCVLLGVLLFIVGVTGLSACIFESQALLITFLSLVLIIFIGQIVCAGISLAYKNQLYDVVKSTLQDELDRYGEDSKMSSEIDLIQKEMHCCGITNASDWHPTLFYNRTNHTLPGSCCPAQICASDLQSTVSVVSSPAAAVITVGQDLRRRLDHIKDSVVDWFREKLDLPSSPQQQQQQEQTAVMSVSAPAAWSGHHSNRSDTKPYQAGCLDQLLISVRGHFVLLIVIAGSFILCQMLGAVAVTSLLLYNRPEIDYHQLFFDPNGLQI